MSNKDTEINNQNDELDTLEQSTTDLAYESNQTQQNLSESSSPKWINNRGEEVKQVFGFNENAELVNARVAMIGFLMLILTELAFSGEPATQKIFGIS